MLFCMTPKQLSMKVTSLKCFRAMLFCMTPKRITQLLTNLVCFRAMLFCMTPKLTGTGHLVVVLF